MTATAKALVRHLIRAQVDNPDHIHLISPLTQTYDLLMAAAEELFGQPAADIKAKIDAERAAIQGYRPLVAEVERQRSKAERYERALDTIAHDHPDSAQGRRARGAA